MMLGIICGSSTPTWTPIPQAASWRDHSRPRSTSSMPWWSGVIVCTCQSEYGCTPTPITPQPAASAAATTFVANARNSAIAPGTLRCTAVEIRTVFVMNPALKLGSARASSTSPARPTSSPLAGSTSATSQSSERDTRSPALNSMTVIVPTY